MWLNGYGIALGMAVVGEFDLDLQRFTSKACGASFNDCRLLKFLLFRLL